MIKRRMTRNCAPSIAFLALTLVLLLCNGALCADQLEASRAVSQPVGVRQPRHDWNVQLNTIYLAPGNLSSMDADSSISDTRLRLTRNFRWDTATTLTIGGGYGIKHIDAPSSAKLPQDLHALSLETGLNYRINPRSFINLKIFPGLYSDFNEVGNNDIRMPLLALGGYSFENGVQVVGGFLYRVGYHSAPFLPILGLSYQPVPEWRIDLVMPRPGVTYIPSQQLRLFVAGDFTGDEYQIHDATVEADALKYRDLRIMGGFDYLPKPGITCSAAVGYAFDRSFEFYDSARNSLRINDVPFVKLSLDIGW
ncbi:MAG TPA: hypothetical protein HPP94_04255 [Desulfuromonadales bacterium]|nr:hypothetical protein [Desulfuromonadales bacterium]